MVAGDVGTRVGHVGAVERHHLPDVDAADHEALVVDALEESLVVLERLLALAFQPVEEVDAGEELRQSVRGVRAVGARPRGRRRVASRRPR